MNKAKLLTATSVAAICAVLGMRAAQAQGDDIEQVVVSASRISLAGYQQPTPVTVVDAGQMERDAQANLSNLFSQMPEFGTSTTPETQNGSQSVSGGGAGAASINLRNIGTNRTLVLINSTRVVAGDYTNSSVDINMIPDVLIKRIDIVTGGASAVWGSDAVAGVVNFVMDNNFTGIKASVEASDDQWDIREEAKIQGAWGASFLGDRGHFVIGGSYWDAPQVPLISQTPYSNYGALMNNPAYTATNGQPQLLNIRGGAAGSYDLGFSAQTSGGLVATGPLKGLQFSGGNGQTSTFNFGNVTGPLSYGGSAQTEVQAGLDDAIALPIKNTNFYAQGSYNLFGNVKASLELELSGTAVANTSATNQTVDTITSDNAYLQAYPQVLAAMAAAKVTSIPVGTTNINDVGLQQQNVNVESDNSVGLWKEHSFRQMERAVFGLSGSNNVFGTDWAWSTTLQQSENHRYAQFYDVSINQNYTNAVDAVYVTPANVGASGLAIGSIACRSTLLAPTNGCQPLDIFGDGVASQAAINYISPGPGNPLQEYQSLRIVQDTGNITIQGEPFSIWAGPVAVAFGGDYRKEFEAQTANALSYAKGYAVGNFQPFNFHYETEEAFGEINAPLLKDNAIVESLDFDAAGRYTNYSTSGGVDTWKLGLVSQVNGDVRLRTSWSTDIRAPGLYELFNPGSFAGAQTIPGQTQTTTSFSGGNINLKPEVAINLEAGVVLTPHWIDGLTMSADYWSINVHGAVITPNNTQILALCRAGQQVYCAELTGYPGVITQVASVPINAATTTESGTDFQADYVQDAFDGTMHIGFKGTYTDHLTTTSSIGRIDNANSLNGDTGGGGAPKFRGTLSATYDEKPWSVTAQSRLIGAAAINNLLQVGTGPTTFTGTTAGLGTIANNYVAPVAYLDLRASYDFGEHIQFYGAMDNVLDTPPPYIPSTPAESNVAFFPAWNSSYYDTFGRVFRLGVRLNY